MMCSNPEMLPNYFAPCGKCQNCLRMKRYQHVSNMIAELKVNANATFITLTYDMDHQPLDSVGRGVLDKADLQRFFKRIRKQHGSKLRYYSVGEYGGKTWRPHYHVALFGYPNCLYGKSKFQKPRAKNKSFCCGPCNRIRDSWGKGIVQLDELNGSTIGYTAGYISKKLTSASAEALDGRPPEFSTMSLRPGLGHIFALLYIRKLAEALEGNLTPRDIPKTFHHRGNPYRFSRNHRNTMRAWCGFERKLSQQEWNEYVKSYSTLPFLQEESPKAAFLASWQGERSKFEARKQVKHEKI